MLLFKTSKQMEPMVNVQEAYNLWDLVTSKYQYLEHLNLWENFIHDPDLKYFVSSWGKIMQQHIDLLEDKLRQFSINGPEVGVKDTNSSMNMEAISDRLIAQDMLLWVQGSIELCLRSLRTSTTNDELRNLFMKMVKRNIDFLNTFIKYLRLKGWIGISPYYPNIPSETTEKIDSGEAFHLWDHLTFRYDNIHQTEIYVGLANDSEFKTLLTIGLQNILKKQAVTLERECLKFGIPLPKHSRNVVAFPKDISNYFCDEFMYRSITIGIIGATLLHALAVKQCTTNDRLRQIFIDLLNSEIDIIDSYIKYGKIKGYLNEVPRYSLG